MVGGGAILTMKPSDQVGYVNQLLRDIHRLEATNAALVERQALQNALFRSGGHWERVLYDWMGAERYGKRVGMVQGALV